MQQSTRLTVANRVLPYSVYSYIQFHPLMYLIKLAIESEYSRLALVNYPEQSD